MVGIGTEGGQSQGHARTVAACPNLLVSPPRPPGAQRAGRVHRQGAVVASGQAGNERRSRPRGIYTWTMSYRAPRRHHTVPRLYLRAFAERDQVHGRPRQVALRWQGQVAPFDCADTDARSRTVVRSGLTVADPAASRSGSSTRSRSARSSSPDRSLTIGSRTGSSPERVGDAAAHPRSVRAGTEC